MNSIDGIIDKAIYSINPSTGLSYPQGFIQVADGLGTRIFTSTITGRSLTTSTLIVNDLYPALTLSTVTASLQIRYNKTPNAIDIVGTGSAPGVDLSSNDTKVKSLTIPSATGAPQYLTIAGSQNSYPPVGMITLYGGATGPIGWLQCNGATPLIATYPALAAVLGTRYGPVTATTFTLPGTAQLPTIPAPPLGIYIIKY